MPGITAALRQSIAGLSVEEKADLVLEMLHSMEGAVEPDAEPQVEMAWAAEIERRAERARAGQSQGTDWYTVRARIERSVFGA